MLDFILLLPFIFLTAAIVTCWLRVFWRGSRAVPLTLLSIAISLGLFQGILEFITIVPILLLLICCRSVSEGDINKISGKTLSTHGIFVILVVLFSYHLLPGFHNPTFLHHLVLGPNSPPYTLYANFDKAVVGFAVLCFVCPLINSRASIYACLTKGYPICIGTISVVLGLCLILNVIQWSPKPITAPSFVFYPCNLFFTCVAEEACFRGYLQPRIHKLFKVKNLFATCITVIISGLLFGLAHWGGGISYIAIASLAGIGYSWVYQRTGQVEASILTHFLLNAIHFQIFTYPYALNSP